MMGYYLVRFGEHCSKSFGIFLNCLLSEQRVNDKSKIYIFPETYQNRSFFCLTVPGPVRQKNFSALRDSTAGIVPFGQKISAREPFPAFDPSGLVKPKKSPSEPQSAAHLFL